MTNRKLISRFGAVLLIGMLAVAQPGGPASAAPTTSSGAAGLNSSTGLGAAAGGGGSAAVAAAPTDYEVDFATAGTLPEGLACTDFDWTNRARACWEANGDVVWVLNYSGSQAVGWWWNYRNGTLYRQGKCINNGRDWGYCNKNMYEKTQLQLRACTTADQSDRECSAIIKTTT